MVIYFVLGLLISAVILGGGFIWLKKQSNSATAGTNPEALLSEVRVSDKTLADLVARKEPVFSNAGFEDLQAKVATMLDQAAKERDRLKEIESKLETSQKAVEAKEQDQQETKAAKDEDITKVQEILANYDTIESAAIELEQKLATSLKSLDSILTEVALSAPQKEGLRSLSDSVTEAGARLRDLLSEAQTVNERLNGLQMQHQELESEYTRLVEQQLGD